MSNTAAIPPVAALEPMLVPHNSGPFVDLGDHRGHVIAGSASTGGAFILFEMTVDPGGGVPPHIHAHEDETFYIMSGRVAFQVGDRLLEAGPGDSVFAPRNLMHAWQCVSPEPAHGLLLVTPAANFEAFALAMAQMTITPSDPASIAALTELAARHGIEMLPPVK